MRIAAQNIRNNGIQVVASAFEDCVAKYQNIRSLALYDLFSMYYLPTPSEFDKYSFFKALWEEFGGFRKYVTSKLSGEIVLEPEMLDYAMKKANNTEFTEVLSAFKRYHVANLALRDCFTFSSKTPFKRKSIYKQLKSRVDVSSKVSDNLFKGYNTTVYLEWFNRKPSTKLVGVDLRDLMLEGLAKKVGVSHIDFIAHKRSNKALFIADFSFEDELRLIKFLCNGTITADGDFAEQLNSFVDSHYVSDLSGGSASHVSNIQNDIFLSVLRDMCDRVALFRTQNRMRAVSEFYVTNDFVYFEIDQRSYDTSPSCNVALLPADTRFSAFLVDTVTGAELPVENRLLGVCGELISRSSIMDFGYYIDGLPVKIRSYRKTNGVLREDTEDFFYIEDVHYSDERNSLGELTTKSLIPKVGNSILLDGISDITLTESDVSSFIKTCFETFSDNATDEYVLFVEDCMNALVSMSNGNIGYSLSKFYPSMSDNDVTLAICDAALLFNKLKFRKKVGSM